MKNYCFTHWSLLLCFSWKYLATVISQGWPVSNCFRGNFKVCAGNFVTLMTRYFLFIDPQCVISTFRPGNEKSIYIYIYLTNRFQVAVRLFSNRSQMTSKCGKKMETSVPHVQEQSNKYNVNQFETSKKQHDELKRV